MVEADEAGEAVEATTSDTGIVANNDIAVNLWVAAYKSLFDREPDLVADYERYVGARPQGQDNASRAFALSSPDLVKGSVKALQENRENKQWKVSIRGKDHKVRDHLEKLVKLLTISDSVIRQAVSAQPYAALAWSAVSVFLPLLTSSFATDAAMVKGFAVIADLQLYWKNCQDVFLQSAA